MVQVEATIKNQAGIHARPASTIVGQLKTHSANIELGYEGKTANAQSLIGILALGVKCGGTVTISVDGENESAIAEEVKTLLESLEG